MDELWQRYRTFWTPVLIGVGVFLLGIIAVHVMSPDPEVAAGRLANARRDLKRMEQPDRDKITLLEQRAEAFGKAALGDDEDGKGGWLARVSQVGAADDPVAAGARQALRAAILRGAPEDATSGALAERFDDDEIAAEKAKKRYLRLAEQHAETLRTGDPNVAWGRLLSDVWSELRIRANRQDVDFSPPAEQLGFAPVGSVSRATLPARVLNLALIARIVDVAIREGAESVDMIGVPINVDPGAPDAFMVTWPVDVNLVGDDMTLEHLLALLTDPQAPVPVEFARFTQPKSGPRSGREGLAQINLKVSSVLVRPQADLALEVEEDS